MKDAPNTCTVTPAIDTVFEIGRGREVLLRRQRRALRAVIDRCHVHRDRGPVVPDGLRLLDVRDTGDHDGLVVAQRDCTIPRTVRPRRVDPDAGEALRVQTTEAAASLVTVTP